ncbi:MAG: hypothetical protein ABIA74_03055 [bacterium]
MKKLCKVLSLILAINIFANSQSNAFLGLGILSNATGWTASWFCNNPHVSSATNTELSKQLMKNFYTFAKNSPELAQKLLIQTQKLIANSNINWENSKELACKTTTIAIELIKQNPEVTFYTALGLVLVAILKNQLTWTINKTTNITKEAVILGTKASFNTVAGTAKLGINIASSPAIITSKVLGYVINKI